MYNHLEKTERCIPLSLEQTDNLLLIRQSGAPTPLVVLAHIGSGGFAEVFSGLNLSVAKECAIKISPPTQDHKNNLANEATLLAKISPIAHHSPRYQLFIPNAQLQSDSREVDVLAMDLIQGQNLKDYYDILRKEGKSIPLTEIIEYMAPIAKDLAYQSLLNRVVHRDIKMSNILISKKGVPYLTDFGLAKGVIDSKDVLSYEHQAPELMPNFSNCSHQSDIYSLGLLVYKLVANRSPYSLDAITPVDIVAEVLAREPLPITEVDGLKSKYSAPVLTILGKIFQKTLCKDPRERYANSYYLANDLISIGRHLTG